MKKYLKVISLCFILLFMFTPKLVLAANYGYQTCITCDTFEDEDKAQACIEKYCDPSENWLGNTYVSNASAADSLKFCERTAPIWQFVGYGIIALKILVPLVVIILGIIDLAKAIVNSDDKAISKAVKSLAMRFLTGVVIFFVPTLVDVVFGFLKDFTGDSLNNIGVCETCLLNANSSECEAYVDVAAAEVDN